MPMEKTFQAATREPEITAKWKAAGISRAGANAKPGKEAFAILLPPPNVTGFLHVGHAFNHTLMDVLIRWKRMQGFDTLWQPGLDHAGIATQLVVEKQLAEQGQKRTDMTREDFVAKVWDWKAVSGGKIEEQDDRLGSSMDWSRAAFTMDEGYHDAVIRTFVEMYDKGYIYRGKRLVNWDPHFETAISDLEVENAEVDGHMWHFKYPLAGGATYTYEEKDEDGNVLFTEDRNYISIATTRPETMLGDGAVAVHPSDTRYAPIVGQLCEIPVGPKEHRRQIPIITDDYPDPTFGSGAVKITGAHDFNDYGVATRNGIPLYSLMDTRGAMRADGLAYADAAARAQAIAKGADAPDDVTEINLVPDHLRGLDRMDARARVIEEITAEGLAVMVPESDPRLGRASASSKAPKDGAQDGAPTDSYEEGGQPPELALVPLVEPKKIMQPFGDRSKVVIEPMLTDQWFVDTDQIVGPALDAVKSGRVKIMPESGEKTFYHWLENIEPWCISRQLWWGHQIPVWYGPSRETLAATPSNTGSSAINTRDSVQFVAATHYEALTKAKEYYGADVEIGIYFDLLDESRTASDRQPAYRYGNGTYTLLDANRERFSSNGRYVVLTRDPDVLDTWFSSGLFPVGTLGWPDDTDDLRKYFPSDVLITGQDILFFWVARMMMMSRAVMDDDPFHTVYLHQLVRDAKGEKMSKTRGNVVDPLDMIDQYGADALRFTNVQMAALGGVLKISEDRIKGYRNFVTKLWNACRFAEMNEVFAHRAKNTDAIPTEYRPVSNAEKPVNRWIVGETARVLEDVDAALAAYRFNDAANALYAFVWGRVCDWYVELSKPLLMDGTPAEREETQRVMAWVLDQCLIMLHPIMPFVTEELWSTLAPRATMLAVTDWPTYVPEDLVDTDAETEMRWTIAMIEGIRSARSQMNVPAGLQVPVIKVDSTPDADRALASNLALIQRLARVDSVTDGPAPKGSLTVATPGATFALPLADLIDVDAEKARLSKTLAKLQKEIGGLEGRLKNPNFAASAPADVVAEAEANLAARQEERAQLETALARLAEID